MRGRFVRAEGSKSSRAQEKVGKTAKVARELLPGGGIFFPRARSVFSVLLPGSFCMSDIDLIIRGASVVLPDGVDKLDLGLKDGVIAAMGTAVFGSTDADLDASEFHVLPGLVDPHVHFNEPGRTDWESLATGSRACAVGGTTFFDMPLNSTLLPLSPGATSCG